LEHGLFFFLGNAKALLEYSQFMVKQKKQELNQMNSKKDTNGEEEAKKSSKEKEEVLDSDNAALNNTKNKVF
jgi:hypothetical protein